MKSIQIHFCVLFIFLILLSISCSQNVSNDSEISLNETPSIQKARIAFAVSDLSVGTHRLAFGIIEPGIGAVKNEEVKLETFFFQNDDRPLLKETLAAKFQSWPVGGKGVYTTDVTFDVPGKWGVGVSFKSTDGIEKKTSSVIKVTEESQAPSIGDKAFPSNNTTTNLSRDISNITTDSTPYKPFYEYSIAESINEGKPILILFGSPAFCTTGTCGPQIDIVKNLHSDFSEDLVFIHVEIYENPTELKGDISNAKVVQAVKDWNLPSEPWIFLVDQKGVIKVRFEGLATYQEIEMALIKNNFLISK